MLYIPTYIDLFGDATQALAFYRKLFPLDTINDTELTALINLSYEKISPIFGEFRDYKVGEDTVRNNDVKKAVCFETNAIYLANLNGGSNIGGLNTNTAGTDVVVSEKMEDVSVTFAKGGAGAELGLGDDSLKNVLGLLSTDAAILLSRYIRKTYNWGHRACYGIDPNKFCGC